MPDGSPAAPPIPFIDLDAQRRAIGPRMEEAILRVVQSGKYILGPEVGQLEKDLAAFCGAPCVLSCANGTDALELAIIELLGQGDGSGEILTTSHTFIATADAIVYATALSRGADLLTCDRHFDGMPGVRLVPKSSG